MNPIDNFTLISPFLQDTDISEMMNLPLTQNNDQTQPQSSEELTF